MLLEALRAQSRVRQALLFAGAAGAVLYAIKNRQNKNKAKEEEELKKRYSTRTY
jgi:hypothetical protein